MKLAPEHIKKIAVFRALKIGDMLCAVPALRALRAAYPNAEITLLGLPWAKSFASRFHQYIDRFIHFPGCPGLPEQVYDETALRHFISNMKAEHFDLVLQMQGNGSVVNPLMFLFDAKHTAGFYNDESYVESELFMPYPASGYEAQRLLSLVEFLGVPSQGLDLEFPVTEKDEEEATSLCLPLVKKGYVCVHPGSAAAWRQWPPRYFAGLADYCIEKGYTVVITGTQEESDITAELIKCMHHPALDTTGKTGLGGAAVLIKNAAMLISNCTGVAHIAAAVKTPSIIVSMDGEPERWAPLNKRLHHVIDWTKEPHFETVFNETVHALRSIARKKTAGSL